MITKIMIRPREKVQDGKVLEESIEILSFEGVKQLEELPNSYHKEAPYYFLDNIDNQESIVIWLGLDVSRPLPFIRIRKGDIFDKKYFDVIVKLMKRCGNKLHNSKKDAEIVYKEATIIEI